ncbi:MAG TPA: MBOAT family protein [Gaiellaceae bacterium]|nr:MBOAT family protein [Gaiellaceae bacterium]
MLFPTATFTLFFLVVLPLSWLAMADMRRWRLFIIAASYVFYGWWDWHFVFLLAGCTLWTHVLALQIDRAGGGTRRALVALAVTGQLSLLGYFKYYDFFVSSSHNLAHDFGVGLPISTRSIVLPVGISFFTFMAISYVVDTYRGQFKPVTLPRFAAYLSFFPHLVAGPIVRPNELIPQMETRRDPRRVDTSRAFYLIATGLFKKVVIANYLATHICDPVFAVPGSHSSLEILIAVYAYAVQIYADFSGYTDMAIGLALLLGFTFPQNFDSPYTATSLQNFWRRWHMTLSRWLRDYLYIPLGGNRKGRVRTYFNLIVTMLLGGLWHGASWTFVVWGGIHGTGLAFERWRRDRSGGVERSPGRARIWAQRLVTFNVVCLAWIFFRSDSIARAWEMITGLFTRWGAPSPLVSAGVLSWIVVGIGSQYLPARFPLGIMARFSRLPVLGQAVVLGAALMLANAMGPAGVSPFIYYRF